MITRDEAFVIIKKYLRHEDNLRKSLAVEAIMREIAKKLERDVDLWGLTGLLHNIDYEYTSNEPENRGVLSAQLLEDLLPEKAVNAIKANNYTHTDYIPTTSLDKSLIAVDSVTGLILATVQSLPSKRIKELGFQALLDKFYDAEFAARYNRNKIQLCTDIGMNLDAFLKISLDVLKKMSDQLNL